MYDSHVHWLMTGEKKSFLDLQKLQTLSELSVSDIEKKNFRGNWLFGFGWNDSQLTMFTAVQELDRLSSEYPICFIKRDAHSCILNSAALELVLPAIEKNETMKTFVERSADGRPNGILKEIAFYSIYAIIPALTKEEMRDCLLEAQDYFLKKGFTCIRDMTCSSAQWNILTEMQQNGALKLFADINFNGDTLEQIQSSLIPLIKTESQVVHKNLKIRGIKIFYDGSLGSRTALLFDNYKGTSSAGNGLWSDSDLYQAMKWTWENNFEFSVHTLGDKAVDKVVEVARRLYSEKNRGYLNLEHVELIHPETINKMKSLFVRCHMQPSHWLSDKVFLNDRLPSTAIKKLFAWEALRKARVALSFGSDSPIEEADVALTYKALKDSALHGVEELGVDMFDFYSHPELSKLPSSPITSFEGLLPIHIES